MFRMIAIALISTFALLGVMAGDGGAPGAASANRSSHLSPPEVMVGSSYVVASPAILMRSPEPTAETLTELGMGSHLLLLGRAAQGFARVRDPASGHTGYIDASALSALP